MANRSPVLRTVASAALAAALFACDSPPPIASPHSTASSAAEPSVAESPHSPMQKAVVMGRVRVESFFGAPFPDPFEVVICPSRAEFDALLARSYGIEASQCWMVAAGGGDALAVLDPSTWKKDACEHDPDDAAHVQGIVTHELVHVFHGQKNPTRDFDGMDDLGWFVEGLATYASGQLEREHAGKDKEAIAAGAAPKSLATAWSGKYRYAVCGSLVRFVDERFGRETTLALLAATTPDEALGILGTSEVELLADWKASVSE